MEDYNKKHVSNIWLLGMKVAPMVVHCSKSRCNKAGKEHDGKGENRYDIERQKAENHMHKDIISTNTLLLK